LTGSARNDNLRIMKTLTRQQAGKKFLEVADLAHQGETVEVTHSGRVWCRIVPPSGILSRPKSAAEFQARLAKMFPKPLPARVMAEFIENR
jgi:antitoxin (DNA-binding transcriptional repressor) of toxin-antitoxin stability system